MKNSTPEAASVYDVIIIGAGPCGLATAAHLRKQHPSALFTDEEQARYHWVSKQAAIKNKRSGRVTRGGILGSRDACPSMLVLDSNGKKWMSKWNALFLKHKIRYLRSPMFFHPDPSDRDALLSFMHAAGRPNEAQEIAGCVGKELSKHQKKRRIRRGVKSTGRSKPISEINERERRDYFARSSACFGDFCIACRDRYDLDEQQIIRQEAVQDIDYDVCDETVNEEKLFRVVTDAHCYFVRSVVLAVGGGEPFVPAPFGEMPSNGASHALDLEQKDLLSGTLAANVQSKQLTSVLVIGGGLTSAQAVDGLIRRGVSQIHLVMRGALKVKPFDIDLSWMSKYKNHERAAFWATDSFEERLDIIKRARNGGSITPRFKKILESHIASSRLNVHCHTTVSGQSYSETNQNWTITSNPSISGLPAFDHIVFATGTHIDITSLPYLETLHRKYPIQTYSGLPALNNDLQWAEDVPLFVTGRLAAL